MEFVGSESALEFVEEKVWIRSGTNTCDFVAVAVVKKMFLLKTERIVHFLFVEICKGTLWTTKTAITFHIVSDRVQRGWNEVLISREITGTPETCALFVVEISRWRVMVQKLVTTRLLDK